MTHKEINELYEQSVYQIRLTVAISLLHVMGVSHRQALEEADRFVELLQSESKQEVMDRFM